MAQPDFISTGPFTWHRSELASEGRTYRISWELFAHGQAGVIITADAEGVRIFATSKSFTPQQIDIVVWQMREAARFHECLKAGRPVR